MSIEYDIAAVFVRRDRPDYPGIRVEAMMQRDGSKLWRIRHLSNSITRTGLERNEPMPSSMKEKHYKMFRFADLDEAIAVAKKFQKRLEKLEAERDARWAELRAKEKAAADPL